MEDKQVYVEKLKSELDKWNQRITELESLASRSSSDVKENIEAAVAQLQTKRQDVMVKISLLREAGDDAWEYLKLGALSAIDELKTAWHDVSSL